MLNNILTYQLRLHVAFPLLFALRKIAAFKWAAFTMQQFKLKKHHAFSGGLNSSGLALTLFSWRILASCVLAVSAIHA